MTASWPCGSPRSAPTPPGSTTTYVAATPAVRGPHPAGARQPRHRGPDRADLAPADRLVLDAFAARTSDRVWTVSTASLLAAADAGRAPGELVCFLDERAVHAVPGTVRRILADVEARAGQVRDLGTRRVARVRRAERRHAACSGPLDARVVHAFGRAAPDARPGRRTQGTCRHAQAGLPHGADNALMQNLLGPAGAVLSAGRHTDRMRMGPRAAGTVIASSRCS